MDSHVLQIPGSKNEEDFYARIRADRKYLPEFKNLDKKQLKILKNRYEQHVKLMTKLYMLDCCAAGEIYRTI